MLNDDLKIAKGEIKYWWISLVVGIMSLAVGIWCLLTPIESLIALSEVMVMALLLSGICHIVFAVANSKSDNYWGWSLVTGILELLLGIWLVILPEPAVAAIFVYVIGFWILFYSVLGIGEACELKRVGVSDWGWLLAFGIITLVLAFIYLMAPAIYGGLFVVVFAGLSFVTYGVFRSVVAFKLRELNKLMK